MKMAYLLLEGGGGAGQKSAVGFSCPAGRVRHSGAYLLRHDDGQILPLLQTGLASSDGAMPYQM
jgi:hypothetical protein